MTVKVLYRDVVGVDCSISITPITDVEDPVQVVPCQHFFSRMAIQAWMQRSTECPMDRRQIESLNQVAFVENMEDGIEDVEVKPKAENFDKMEALKRLERSILGDYVSMKNFVERADQITVVHWREEKKDGASEKVQFTGEPINQLYREYWKSPLPLPKHVNATVTLSKDVDLNGNSRGGGHEICVVPNNAYTQERYEMVF